MQLGIDKVEVPHLGIVKLHGFAWAGGWVSILLIRSGVLHQIAQVHVKGEQAPWWSEILWRVLQQCHKA